MAKTMIKPVVHDTAHNEHVPVSDGQYIDVANIPIADATGNVLSSTDDGLIVEPSDLVSSGRDNQLTIQDGKLYVAPAEEPEDPLIVSADEGNLVRAGSDGGAFASANDLLSNGGINLLTIDPTDNKIILTEENVRENISVISKDEDNLLTEGSDGGVLLTLDDLVSSKDNILTLDGGKLATELTLSYDTTSGVLRLLGVDNAEVGQAVVPTSTSALRSVEFTRYMPDEGGENVRGDYYVSLAFKFANSDAWDGGEAVKVTTTNGTSGTTAVTYTYRDPVSSGVFPARVKATFMGQSVEQALNSGSSNTITFDDGTKLVLTWGSSSGTTLRFDAALTPAIGLDVGAYLRMVWLLADNTVTDVYVEITTLYQAGCGITIDGDGNISAKVASNDGLECNATNGLGVKLPSTSGLQTSTSGLSVLAAPTGGLQVTSAGVGIKPASGGGLVTDGNGTSVDDEWFVDKVTETIRTETQLVTTGNGLTSTVTANGKQISAVAGTGVVVNSSGIHVDQQWLGTQVESNVENMLTEGVISSGDGIDVTVSGGNVTISVDETWLESTVEDAVDTVVNSGTLVAAGNGISVSNSGGTATVSARAATNGGLSVTTAGIQIAPSNLNNANRTALNTALVQADGGISLNSTTGAMYVDFAQMPEDLLANVVYGMVDEGGGLAVNEQGQLYVDFNTMPEDRFNEMLQSIRVPIWLTANKSFYVNQATGSDTLDEGRGESASLPFKTIQACVNYVCDNYNISRYVVTINVAAGTYDESVNLPSYNRVSGYIIIRSEDYDPDSVIVTNISNSVVSYIFTCTVATLYYLRYMTIRNNVSNVTADYATFLTCLTVNQSANVHIQSCNIEINYIGEAPSGSGSSNLRMLSVSVNGSVTFDIVDTGRAPTRFKFSRSTSTKVSLSILYSERSGLINCGSTSDAEHEERFTIYCEGDCSNFLALTSSSMFSLVTGQVNAHRFAEEGEGVTGRRYSVNNGARVQIGGRGEEYFPGTTAGVVYTDTFAYYG